MIIIYFELKWTEFILNQKDEFITLSNTSDKVSNITMFRAQPSFTIKLVDYLF